MSSSPAAKRSLKPSPIAPSSQQNAQFAIPTELPTLQPATTPAQEHFASFQQPPTPTSRKRKSASMNQPQEQLASSATPTAAPPGAATASQAADVEPPAHEPKAKKSRTNTPWTPAEEQRLKQMRDAGNSWSAIAKTFPARTEGSVKKHWYKDMHYAEFGEDESAALLAAIKEYDANKWKSIGQKVGKPAKACEQYAKEHFGGKV
ncbi:hypothetical protein BDV95DRAFT_603283 [Massariosphaeria phaeospora]|uniref:Uncharacterized protein n=1 Tax=Massariosphaeria phaeospora TaxID=100035 RepID=A0A7C8MHW7_9PLEO|nr:hypothetical protein BDV95DRAFT_603283 [Massariosphaeria phaeospora]